MSGSDPGFFKLLLLFWNLEPVSFCIVLLKIRIPVLHSLLVLPYIGTVARQAPPSMGFFRQEYWSGLPCPSPGDLSDPGIEPQSPVLQESPHTQALQRLVFSGQLPWAGSLIVAWIPCSLGLLLFSH